MQTKMIGGAPSKGNNVHGFYKWITIVSDHHEPHTYITTTY